MTTAATPDRLIARLRRAEGQLRGVQRMLEEGADCGDVLVQLAAVKAAVDQVGLRVITGELRTCVEGDGETCDESLERALETFMRYARLNG